jgi:hypothetical protein
LIRALTINSGLAIIAGFSAPVARLGRRAFLENRFG